MDGTSVPRLDVGVSHEMAALARRFCELIDTCAQRSTTVASLADAVWLREITILLSRIHAAVGALTSAGVSRRAAAAWPDHTDLDERFELFARLRRLLADCDGYWLELDRRDKGAEEMTGSLADDLTDIYCELKSGLRLYEQDPDSAAAAWTQGFEIHWGEHLIDAERHLAGLVVGDWQLA